MMTKKITVFAVAALLAATGAANAACFGGPAFETCLDDSGNQYTVNRFGNMTTVYGSNLNTGSQWNETINRFGNMTTYQGMTNGNPWDMTETNLGGGMQTYNGTNSYGQSFSYTCTQFGGCN